MSIQFPCDCGQQLKVGDEYAGKKARCAACGAVTVVPDPDFEYVNEPAAERDRPPAVKRAVAYQADEDDDRPRRRRSRADEDYDDEDDRPRRRSRPERDEPRRTTAAMDDDEEKRKHARQLMKKARKRLREEERERSRGSTDHWSWSWNPLVGIMYGPLPVGLIFVGIILLVGAALGLRK